MKVPSDPPPNDKSPPQASSADASPGGRRRLRTLPSTPRSILDALLREKQEPEPT